MSSWFNFVPSERSSSGKGSHSLSLNVIETIGMKRTRKVSKQDTLDNSQFTQLDEDANVDEERHAQHSKTWRPDEDEMCLTTTTVRARKCNENTARSEENASHTRGGSGIILTKEFEWDEGVRKPIDH
jgi:hypothetical protein